MRFLFIIICISSSLGFSQGLSVSSNQLNFGTTFETAPDSLPLLLSNSSANSISITGIRFYNTYGSKAFSSSDSLFILSPFSTQNIWIKFSPLHNVFHNSEMVILNNSYRGNVSIDLKGQGKYSKTYYKNTENISEQELKDTLQAITGRGYISLGYNIARDKMYMVIDNKKVNGQGTTVNTLECVYTGRNAVGYLNRTDCQGPNYDFNTEHTYPQSYFGSSEPMLSDLYHLFPTDNTANSVRSNYRFGNVNTTPTWTVGGSKFALPFFEPRDQHKGEVARAMFYFVLRYQNYQGFLTTQESALRAWLHAFPPTAIERKRDTDIFLLQKNHNPFIDYPQFVDRITSISLPSSSTANPSIDLTDSMINYGIVASNQNVSYNFVLVNNGNSTVNFSNFGFSNPSLLSFTNGSLANTALLPGESLNIPVTINLSSTDSIAEYLLFTNDVNGNTNYQIPIFANYYYPPSSIHEENKNNLSFDFFPNPAKDRVHFQFKNSENTKFQFKVLDVKGNVKFSNIFEVATKDLEIDLSQYSSGFYTCEISNSLNSWKRKLILIK